jgi:hypothetical integral membrane protein (TIGR02206 family)
MRYIGGPPLPRPPARGIFGVTIHVEGYARQTSIESTFILFGVSHVLTLAAIVSFALATRPLACKASRTGKEHIVAYVLAAILLVYQITHMAILVGVVDRPWSESLPLHLCQMNMFVCAAMLVLRSYRIFEVAYFWGIGGSVAAMLTPDLTSAFPDPVYVIFFLGHTVTVISVLYAVWGYGFRPRFRSVGVTVFVTFVYMSMVMAVNMLFDTNYMYLRAKPEGASVLDYLGPWPWYVMGVVGLGSVVCLLCYAPFAFRQERDHSQAE